MSLERDLAVEPQRTRKDHLSFQYVQFVPRVLEATEARQYVTESGVSALWH